MAKKFNDFFEQLPPLFALCRCEQRNIDVFNISLTFHPETKCFLAG